MFFLGMSAHLFIYLLVPAFLIVCFYFRGAAGSPEVDPILPEAVVYQQTGTSSFEKAYFYQVEKQEQETYSVTASRIFRYFNPFFTSLLPLPTCFYGHLLQLFKLIYSAARILPTSFFN